MGFEVKKRASTPAEPSASQPGTVAALPPALVAEGAKRVGPLALIAFGIELAFGVLDQFTMNHASIPTVSQFIWLGGTIAGLALSLSVAWIAYREMMSPEKILDLAVLYEVLMALCLSLVFHAVPVPVATNPRGWSAVAVWLLAFPLIIPATRSKAVLAAIVTGAMDPIGLAVHAALGQPMSQTAYLQLAPTLFAVVTVIFVQRIVYRMAVEAGKSLDMGSYHLEELLGRGGMGEVWRASHRMLARSSAVKLIRPDAVGAGGADALKRFEREAQATAALRSPHTVEIYDFGTTAGGVFYYVMELLEGYDSETLVQAHGPLPQSRAIYVLRQVCKSLMEAHEAGMVHRDIKPANIFVCRYGLETDFVKVLDFGLVKSSAPIGGHASALTAAGMVAGTAEYISPEMARGDSTVDARADIYSLGCVAYYFLTGKLVFEGGTPMEVLIEHVKTRPTRPSQKVTRPIDAQLEEIILSCLQKDPANRPQTARELERLLAAVPLPAWSEEEAERWWKDNPPERAPRRWVKPGTDAPSVASKPSPIRAAG
jgi:hypothetical protein